MTGFTKKQLIARAQRVSEINSRRLIATPDATGLAMDNALFEIALATLTAPAVGWTDEVELRDVARSGCGYLFTCEPVTPHADERRVIKLYRLPEIE